MSRPKTISPLENRLNELLDHRRQQSRLRSLKTQAVPNSVDFSSNDFLSLSTNPQFCDDYLSSLQKSPQLGSTGSRLLDGNSTLAETLERDIAAFHNAPSALLTNSGFDANVSIFSCLPQPGDVVIYDELIHASVHDGMRQSRAAECIPFKHNDVDDLRRQLKIRISQPPGKNTFVAVESVYSMEGDLAPLQEIVQLLSSTFPDKTGHLVVDEAHATGIYGPEGRGRVSELGLEDRVLVRLHTFGKALACNGAAILTTDTIRTYLLNYARPLIYTTFLSHPSLIAIQLAYKYLQTPQLTAPLMRSLDNLINLLHTQLQLLSSTVLKPHRVSPHILSILDTPPLSPIFALLSTHPRSLASYCQAQGFMVRAVVPPTVPVGTDRVRVCLHAGNSADQVTRLVECVRRWVSMQQTGEGDELAEKTAQISLPRTEQGHTSKASGAKGQANAATEQMRAKL